MRASQLDRAVDRLGQCHIGDGVGSDGLFWVAAVDAVYGSPASLPLAFTALKAAVLGGTQRLVVATGSGGDTDTVVGDTETETGAGSGRSDGDERAPGSVRKAGNGVRITGAL